MMPLLEELTTSVAQKAAAASVTCRSIGVIAILNDLSIHTRSRTLETSTSDPNVIARNVKELTEQFLQSMPTALARRVGIRLSGLSKAASQSDISEFLHE
jgi:nucleotidyltransferase/DNA polymerase involved in DNA repair